MHTIGFIGQGYVGRHMADDFEARGHTVVRYALETPYRENKDRIAECSVVFIAVPTPTTPHGFDYSLLSQTIPLTQSGAIVVIKSTTLPGTTAKLQSEFDDRIVLFSPEFLCEVTAAHDAAHPIFNIIGTVEVTEASERAREDVLSLLPLSPNVIRTTATAAELFKYAHNIHGYMRVVLSNLLYDLGGTLGVSWSEIEQMMNVDPMMSPYYNAPVHKTGRGAGGHCFIKDMAAFRELYSAQQSVDVEGIALLKALEAKNNALLIQSHKDLDLLRGVYGDLV